MKCITIIFLSHFIFGDQRRSFLFCFFFLNVKIALDYGEGTKMAQSIFILRPSLVQHTEATGFLLCPGPF